MQSCPRTSVSRHCPSKLRLPGLMLVLALCTGIAAPSGAADLYVSPSGTDDGNGSAALPFLTINRAALSATPGTTVHVAPGIYAGGVITEASGTPDARIRYVSDVPWGAKIVPAVNKEASGEMAWLNAGHFVDIEGFDIDGQSGTYWLHGIVTRASNTVITRNHIHHIADTVPCTDLGGSAINATHFALGVNASVTANVVHHIGYAGCVYIHGIYFGTSGVVTNNLVYAVGNTGIHLWHDATNVLISNNTVFNSGVGIVVGSGDYYYAPVAVRDTLVQNNIVFDNLMGIAERGQLGPNITFFNNLVYLNRLFNWDILDQPFGTIEADPLFVRYDPQGGGDYQLQANSPAVDRGLQVVAPVLDISGTMRPVGAGIDIGAFESH